MQRKSDIKLQTDFDRLEGLRIVQGFTWKQVAEKLGVGVAMLMMVKSGRRNLSKKSLYRLEQAEVAAGLRPTKPSKNSISKSENPNLDHGLNRLRSKLSTLDSKSQARVLKAILQIVEGLQKQN